MLIDSAIMKIKCDKCSMEMSDEYTYYSFDVYKVDIYNNNKPELSQIIDDQLKVCSKDICTLCADEIFKLVIQNNEKEIKSKRIKRNYDACEITGEHMIGNYSYYYIVVDKVKVNVRSRIIDPSKRFVEFKSKSLSFIGS